jgi:putative addiction module component
LEAIPNEVTKMTVVLPLESMTLADKLEVMELLWADLSRQPAALPSPPWHRDVLQERRRRAAEGTLKFFDWDTALVDLREELHGNPAS